MNTIFVYDGGGSPQEIYPIDLPGWLEAGWMLQPLATTQNPPVEEAPPEEPSPSPEPELSPLETLKAKPWQELETLANSLGLTKPAGLPWKEFCEAILAAQTTPQPIQ